MPSLELTNEQVSDLVKQLPPSQQQALLVKLAEVAESGRDRRMALAESRMQQMAAQRGRKWDAMSEDDREAFVDELMHEERACRI